jgi:PQQ-dependent dehydrogenase (methanol/ethanol family)
MRLQRLATAAVVGMILTAVAVTVSDGATAPPMADGNWLGFGRTPDNTRHSPLTEITPANVAQLGRVYTDDFKKIDPTVKIGEQSYPVAVDGQLYVTSNDDNVFKIDAATGKVLWQYKPADTGVFKNFGIVANRGVAYCNGKLFLLTLDMHINELSPVDGHLVKRVTIAHDVPGAGSNYGYSETSAPICANGRVVFGAAGSEYGTRGFVMAYTTNLVPAWPSPYWTIPPAQQAWRSQSRIAGGGNVWTPVTVDTSTDTVFFGTGSATPLYFPSVRPGPNPRTDSLIAVDLKTGLTKWWQQLISGNQWSYDVAQPPLVYDGKVGGKTHHIVSVASMEGVWFAFDAATGKPFYQRVKVIDRVEHPSLQPGQPVTIYPSSIGGLNYSPASYDAATNYVFNAAAETASQLVQSQLTPAQKHNKFVLGAVFLGVQNGNFGTQLAGWHDHGSISAIDVATGQRVWKFQTPEPERGGVTTTASGLGFAGGGDGNLRAFDLKTGKILWTFQTGAQIASGPTIFSAAGKEYVAITVGGTPTSSNGGTASQLQVFAIGGASTQSPGPKLSSYRPGNAAGKVITTGGPLARNTLPKRSQTSSARSAAGGGGRIDTQSGLYVQEWNAASQNSQLVTGDVLLHGKPVSGVAMQVGDYPLPGVTNSSGQFSYRVDTTLPARHVTSVASLANARIGGRALSAAERSAIAGLHNGFTVGYNVTDLHTTRGSGGNVVLTGRAVYGSGKPVPPVVLFTYQLSGTVTDAAGKPVVGAIVVSRTQDRDFWTFSKPTDASGHYTSFFAASDESGADPVPLTVQVASGTTSFSSGFGPTVKFGLLKSATLDIQLPGSPTAVMALPTATSYQGAIYEGLILGVSGPNGLVRPVSASWPDRNGRFRLTLPASVRGKKLSIWEDLSPVFSSFPAAPGGRFDMKSYPTKVLQRYPQGIATIVAK